MTHMAPTPPAPEPPKKKKKHPVAWVIAGIATIVIIGSVANSGNSTPKTAAPKGTPAPVQATAVSAASTPAAPAGPVLSFTGNGTKQSQNFTVTHDQWTIAYTYDCNAALSGQGNFQIYLYQADGTPADAPVNELGVSGGSSTTEHGAGSYYLEVNSECTWTVTVTG